MKHPNERRPLDRLRNPRALQGLTLVAAMAAASCGGGGGGGAAAGSGPLSGTEGRLAPLVVGGLSYETETLSGITDAGGRFRYEPGESVRFFLGDTTLGTVEGGPEVSLFDLTEAPMPTSNDAIHDALWSDSSYQALANMAQLLEVLDRDGDPGNGIEITEQVAALFAGASIDFRRSIGSFDVDRDVRGILNASNDADLLAGHRVLPKHARVLQRVYGNHGVPIGFGMTSHVSETVMDGELEVLSSETITHEAMSTQRVVDGDGFRFTHDGLVDAVYIETYDENDNLLSRETDGGYLWGDDGLPDILQVDGTVDSSSKYEYDIDGNRVRTESEWDGQPGIDYIGTSQYDRRGRLIATQTLDGDGMLLENRAKDYDAVGNIASESYDSNGDGTFESIWSFAYDGEGHQILAELRVDGALSRSASRQFIGDELVSVKDDRDGDGALDYEYTGTLDANGNLVSSSIDRDGDGVADRFETNEFDSHGNVVRRSTDSDGDSAIDRIDEYSYDASGQHQIGSRADTDGDGHFDYIRTLELDEEGRVLQASTDNDGDGAPETRYSYGYDADGNEVLRLVDDGADGVIDWATESEFDQHGNRTRRRQLGGNGELLVETRTEWAAGVLRAFGMWEKFEG